MREIVPHPGRRGFLASLLGCAAWAQFWPLGSAAARVPGTSGHRRSRSTRRIDLELQDADIYDVLDLFAEIGKVSIVAERGIPHKKVTARLTGVPWDEALVAILRSVGLGMLRDGSVIYVVSADR